MNITLHRVVSVFQSTHTVDDVPHRDIVVVMEDGSRVHIKLFGKDNDTLPVCVEHASTDAIAISAAIRSRS